MINLEAWVRRWFGHSQLPSSQLPLPPNAASPAAAHSAFDRKLDAVIAAAEMSIAHSESLALFAAGNNGFAVALYNVFRRKSGNHFFSPFSIRSALTMVYAGATGETAAQMREALRVSMPDEALHAACAELIRSLIDGNGAQSVLAVANTLWSQVGIPLAPFFVDLVAKHYEGAVKSVDFRREADAAEATINQWVEERTKGRISDLIAPGSLGSDTRLVLANAVYFKALWSLPFDKQLTHDEPFYLDDGREVRTPLMHQIETIGYHQSPGYQAVRLPYRATDLSMLVLLPDRKDGLQELESTLSAAMLRECLKGCGWQRVKLFLPRFKFTWGTIKLEDSLAALGMRQAFTPRADFSRINGRAPPDEEALFLTSVLHKAFVDVNEEGTEAAAATAALHVCLGPPSPRPPVAEFRADHPFLFAICDRGSGAVVFLGRVVDPTREN